jgi:DNA-binding transcriptional regulator YdaS (Cro superfamily)
MSKQKKKYEALINRVSEAAGGPTQLASEIGISVQAIDKWKKNGVPAERVLDVEKATKQKVTRHEIRPDIYPRGA